MDRELTLVERARVQMHLLVCIACRNFTNQMNLIRQAMRKLTLSSDNDRNGDPE
jgi:predicted anti-sigma-YlaC factor YlaD